MFGGYRSGPTITNDTWDWNGSTWAQAPGSSTTPPVFEHSLCYDLARQRLVLGSGVTSSSFDVWEHDGASWAPVAVTGPVRRTGHAMVHDARLRRSVLFAGSFGSLHDLWLYGALTPAALSVLNAGCAGPALTGSAPALGEPVFALDLVSAPPLAPAVLGIGTAVRATALGPCTAWLDGTVAGAFALTRAGGFANWKLPVPAQNVLRGSAWSAQAFVAAAGGPVPVLAVSNGVRLIVGD